MEQSSYGRVDGWEVEIDTVKIGVFTKPIFEDMYWYSYEFVLINPLFENEIYKSSFWERKDLKFFSKALDEYSDNQPIVNFLERRKRFLVKGLYIQS